MKLRFALVALPLSMVAGAAEQLDIKTGLWEITSVMQISGVPPLSKELLDQMTPEQRRKMEADFKAQAAQGPQVDTDRECITQQDLEQPFESADAEDCKSTIVKTSRTTQEVRLACTGDHQGSGLFKVTTSSRDTMNATLDLKMGAGANTMTIKGTMQGRWLSEDCGDEADDEYEYDEEDTSDDDVNDDDEVNPE